MDKILAIDDENINRMMVRKILGDSYEVLTVPSGEEALENLRDFTPILILLDIHMQGIDGYETFERIREIEGLQEIPIIFLTADDDVDAEIRGFEMGADDFIRKPFVSAVVRRRVERSIDHYMLHRDLQSEVRRQTQRAEKRRKDLKVLSMEIIQTLATAIDAKDKYTKGHSTRVADYASLLAQKLGWEEGQIEKLGYKALLHDVGKIGIPDRVLNKAGRLTDEEFEVIKSHTTTGAELLRGVSSLSNMYKVARNHHERYDGTGYPDGLCGEEIPEEARLVGIADAYDAMSSDRVYRKALPAEVIRQELVKGRGTQFDPRMLDAFLELFDHGELDVSKYEPSMEEGQLDVSQMLQQLLEESYGSVRRLDDEALSNIYRFLHSVYGRHGFEYNTVLISMEGENSTIPVEDMEQAMKAMDYSITQSMRKADIAIRLSDSQYMLVLTEALAENLHTIVERIFAGFYKNCQNDHVKPVYDIR